MFIDSTFNPGSHIASIPVCFARNWATFETDLLSLKAKHPTDMLFLVAEIKAAPVVIKADQNLWRLIKKALSTTDVATRTNLIAQQTSSWVQSIVVSDHFADIRQMIDVDDMVLSTFISAMRGDDEAYSFLL